MYHILGVSSNTSVIDMRLTPIKFLNKYYKENSIPIKKNTYFFRSSSFNSFFKRQLDKVFRMSF